MQSVSMPVSKLMTVNATPADANGNPGALQPGSVPNVVSSDPTIATVTADSSGLNFNVVSVKPGSCQITMSGTNSDGSPISTPFDLTVTGVAATQFLFHFNPPA